MNEDWLRSRNTWSGHTKKRHRKQFRSNSKFSSTGSQHIFSRTYRKNLNTRSMQIPTYSLICTSGLYGFLCYYFCYSTIQCHKWQNEIVKSIQSVCVFGIQCDFDGNRWNITLILFTVQHHWIRYQQAVVVTCTSCSCEMTRLLRSTSYIVMLNSLMWHQVCWSYSSMLFHSCKWR